MLTLEGIYKNQLLTNQDLKKIFEAHELISFNKGDFLLQKEQVSDAYFCVKEGLVRSYVYDFNGNDITTGFIGENEIAIDVVSLFMRVPGVENFQALTNIECYKIDLERFQELYHSIKGLNEWGRAWMSESLFRLKQRSVSMITDSAVERYKILQNTQPEVVKYAPLKYIASYLGITDTSLSRIRKELVKAK